MVDYSFSGHSIETNWRKLEADYWRREIH